MIVSINKGTPNVDPKILYSPYSSEPTINPEPIPNSGNLPPYDRNHNSGNFQAWSYQVDILT